MKTEVIIFLSFLFLTFDSYSQVKTTTIELGSNIKITSSIESFNPKNHEIDTCDTGLGWKAICLIDNNPVFGTDHNMPKYQLLKLTIKINNATIPLCTDYMYDLNWDNSIRKDQFLFKKDEVGYSLYGFFSDGAGSYGVCWKIINNKSFRLIITNSEWFYEINK
jgi:hypothetical protein